MGCDIHCYIEYRMTSDDAFYMGCDIHCYIEYRMTSDDAFWQDFGGRINPGRNYDLFAKMAGVRNYNDVEPVAEKRGYPDDAGFAASGDYWLYVCYTEGEGYCTPERAESYVRSGSRYKNEKKNFVSNPDWHSPSWLTPDEFAEATGGTNEPEYRAILTALRSFELDGYQARLVFWFDN